MMRRLMIETIRQDPGYENGDYTAQPRAMQLANVFYATGTNGGTLAYQKLAPTREQADKLVDERMAAPFDADANDFIYAWESSADYDPDARCWSASRPRCSSSTPPTTSATRRETGITEAAMKLVPSGRLFLIPASPDTRGHGTTGIAKFYAKELQAFLETAPRRTP